MPKINQEEYEVLKKLLSDGYEWVARDSHNSLCAHRHKPVKQDHWIQQYRGIGGNGYKGIDDRLFHFIQWEDEEPYSIAELIREFEWAELNEKYPPVNESENGMRYDFGKAKLVTIDTSKLVAREPEVKKNIKWLKENIKEEHEYNRAEHNKGGSEGFAHREFAFKYVLGLIDQLDEPEVLSQKWIDEHGRIGSFQHGGGIDFDYFVKVGDLQNLLVPEQEEVDQAYKDGYETGKQHTFYKGYLEGLADKESEPEKVVVPQFVADWIENIKPNKSLRVAFAYIAQRKADNHDDPLAFWIEEGNSETFARAWLDGYTVEEEQKYYLKIGNLYLAEPLGDMTSDIVRMTRDKGVAYQFTDEKSIATHLDKFEGTEAVKVEELEE